MTDSDTLTGRLRAIATEHAATVFGIDDLDFLRRQHPEAPAETAAFGRAVSLGVPLSGAALDTVRDRPTTWYSHHYRQVNYQLDRVALMAASMLEEAGYRGLPVPASLAVSHDPMRGHLSHKRIAWAAGLGHIGRNNLLVHPQRGAAVRYVSVLTDAPLPAGRPIDTECKTCRACVAACPAGAIGEAPEAFDLDACYRKLCGFVRGHLVGHHICGVCVAACRGPKASARLRQKEQPASEHDRTPLGTGPSPGAPEE